MGALDMRGTLQNGQWQDWPSADPPVPQYCPDARELDDLELLVTGALAPTRAFNEPGSPVTLTLPPELTGEAEVELVDPEGLPLAQGHDHPG